jgi:hypothetical protein
MVIEIDVPDDWPPALALATRSLFQQAVTRGYPLVTWARPDADPEAVRQASARIRAMLEETGLVA